MSFYQEMKEHRIVAILRDIPAKQLVQVAEALSKGGIRLLEVTMNTKDAVTQIAELSSMFKGKFLIGAGTVLNIDLAKEAISAGATYLITPNLDEEVIQYGKTHGMDVLPGVMTPSEIVQAYRAGASMVKLFPMTSLGVKYLKELQGPLRHIPMVAVGGVTLQNLQDFFDAGAIGVGVGGSLLDKEAIEKGDFETLTNKAKAFVSAIRSERSEVWSNE